MTDPDSPPTAPTSPLVRERPAAPPVPGRAPEGPTASSAEDSGPGPWDLSTTITPESPPPSTPSMASLMTTFPVSTTPEWLRNTLAQEHQILQAEQGTLQPVASPGGPKGPATADNSIFIHNIQRQQQDDTTPWLSFTKWPRYFHQRSLLGLVRAAGMPDTPQVLPALQAPWGGGGSPPATMEELEMRHRHNHLLTLICQGMDRVLDRARATLEQTHTSIWEVFSCRMPGQRTRRRPLGRLQPETEQQYMRYWKQFLCFLIRAISLSCEDRKRLLGVHLDKEQERTLEILWQTLNRYLECPDLDVWSDEANPFRAHLRLPGRQRRLTTRLSLVSEQGPPLCESREATTTPEPKRHPSSPRPSRQYTKRPRSIQRPRSCSSQPDHSLRLHSSSPARPRRDHKRPRLDSPLQAEPPGLQRAVAVCIPIRSSI